MCRVAHPGCWNDRHTDWLAMEDSRWGRTCSGWWGDNHWSWADGGNWSCQSGHVPEDDTGKVEFDFDGNVVDERPRRKKKDKRTKKSWWWTWKWYCKVWWRKTGKSWSWKTKYWRQWGTKTKWKETKNEVIDARRLMKWKETRDCTIAHSVAHPRHTFYFLALGLCPVFSIQSVLAP